MWFSPNPCPYPCPGHCPCLAWTGRLLISNSSPLRSDVPDVYLLYLAVFQGTMQGGGTEWSSAVVVGLGTVPFRKGNEESRLVDGVSGRHGRILRGS